MRVEAGTRRPGATNTETALTDVANDRRELRAVVVGCYFPAAVPLMKSAGTPAATCRSTSMSMR
jgi:hypothetical protein